MLLLFLLAPFFAWRAFRLRTRLGKQKGWDRAKLRAVGLAFGDFFDENPDYQEIFVHDRAEFRGREQRNEASSNITQNLGGCVLSAHAHNSATGMACRAA